MAVTFLLSAAAHELVMVIVTRKLRCVIGPHTMEISANPAQILLVFHAALPDPSYHCLARTHAQAEQTRGQCRILAWSLRGLAVAVCGVCCLLRRCRGILPDVVSPP